MGPLAQSDGHDFFQGWSISFCQAWQQWSTISSYEWKTRFESQASQRQMPPVIKTIGPLHLEDLEPHRFEDLTRQLLYDFRPWRDLEATGRPGGDEGFDARAWEITAGPEAVTENDYEDASEADDAPSMDRQWLIQCKREKRIPPAKLKAYLKDLPDVQSEGLYGIIFVAACDFSKTTRDVFYDETRRLGYMEVKLWGKAEIEDQLFQPKNDHLLFAYFGVSLQVRQRSLKTAIRGKLSTKRKAEKYFSNFQSVLVRDASDNRYPFPAHSKELPLIRRRRWKVFQCAGCFHDGVHFYFVRQMAFIDNDEEHWDVVEGINHAELNEYDDPWANRDRKNYDPLSQDERFKILEKWNALQERNKAWLEDVLVLPYENILAIDEKGDEFFKNPQIFVSAFDGNLPFLRQRWVKIENIDRFSPLRVINHGDKRVDFFRGAYENSARKIREAMPIDDPDDM